MGDERYIDCMGITLRRRSAGQGFGDFESVNSTHMGGGLILRLTRAGIILIYTLAMGRCDVKGLGWKTAHTVYHKYRLVISQSLDILACFISDYDINR